MAREAKSISVFALLAMAVVSYALTMDEDATNNIINAATLARDGGEVAVIVRGPHGRNIKREELLHASGAEDSSVSLYYYRKSNKVSLESLNGGSLKSISWGLVSHATRTTLLLVLSTGRVKLFVGCHALHSHAMPSNHDLFEVLSSKKLKLYHEENAPVEVFNDEQTALNSLNCNPEIRPPTVLTDESDVEEVKEFIEKDARRKREEMQGDDYRGKNYIDSDANGILPTPATQRGDIPANAIETCDDEVIRHLQQLSIRIEQLHRVVADQKGTIDALRGQLRQCCNRPQPQPQPERCTATTCYQGY